jgi:hypothetical protein
MPSSTTPYELSLRAYQVGFGDCFLLTFKYERMRRHILIDFGSTGKPTAAGENLMLRVANDIREACAGKLHGIVATHRHKDHISGFATSGGKGPGDIIASCKPEVVIQPWTEDPRAKPAARGAARQRSRRKAFTASLRCMHEFSAAMLNELTRLRPGLGKGLYNQLAFLGEDNLKNKSAVLNLLRMGKRHLYVRFGSRSGLESLLPGVLTHVLGPPDLEQSDAVSKMRSEHPEEFWHLQSLTGKFISRADAVPLFPAAEPYSTPPPQTRWLIHHMQSLRADQLLEIVRAMDDVLNNTSVIILFEAGGKKFLFPGDAQWENWSYALSKPEVCELLADVHLYKVGHHGSLNATPKSLWKLFKNRSTAKSATRLQCVVSTMAGKHGSAARGTEVPRAKLVEDLKKESEYFSTQELRGVRTFFKDFVFRLR